MQTAIHVLSQNDLRGMITRAGRIRAYCPIHGGDRQRSLSIALAGELQGFGYCHNCKATVLLAELNQDAARRLGYTGDVQELARAEQQAEKWQRDELAALADFYPRMRAALMAKKPRAYLAARAIPFEIAEQLGVCYLPTLTKPQLQAEPGLSAIPRKWYDRLIFPYRAYDGATGYAGRSLALWRPGMDENEHKELLEERGIRRYEKTWRGGWFPGATLDSSEHITLTEGPFDALTLAAAGIADAVANIGTSIEIAAIPLTVCTVTLAFDGDQPGIDAAHKLAKELGRNGRPANICTPPQDDTGKDWSERYRRNGRGGLAVLFATLASEIARPAFNQAQEDTSKLPDVPVADSEPFTCSVCGMDLTNVATAAYSEDGLAYCDYDEVTHNAYCSRGRFIAYVESLARGLSERTGDQWSVTPISKGYTLSEHMERMAKQKREQERERTIRPMRRGQGGQIAS